MLPGIGHGWADFDPSRPTPAALQQIRPIESGPRSVEFDPESTKFPLIWPGIDYVWLDSVRNSVDSTEILSISSGFGPDSVNLCLECTKLWLRPHLRQIRPVWGELDICSIPPREGGTRRSSNAS